MFLTIYANHFPVSRLHFPSTMSSKANINVMRRKQGTMGRSPSVKKEREIKEGSGHSFISKHLKKIYPLGITKSNSSVSLSSLSSTDSSPAPVNASLINREQQKISASSTTTPSNCRLRCSERREIKSSVTQDNLLLDNTSNGCAGGLKRCPWITKTSDEVCVVFHDKHWGVPVYEDNQLFELLALSGMLMFHLWPEILKRRELYRQAFWRFEASAVAKMSEKEIKDIISNNNLGLAESQVRSIVDNAKCILEVTKEFGSFSRYVWGYMNYKPVINRYRYPKSVPLRSPKAEAVSKDLLRRGFRFVGPVIVYSFMQASGMTMDHLLDCFRFSECANLADKWHGSC